VVCMALLDEILEVKRVGITDVYLHQNRGGKGAVLNHMLFWSCVGYSHQLRQEWVLTLLSGFGFPESREACSYPNDEGNMKHMMAIRTMILSPG